MDSWPKRLPFNKLFLRQPKKFPLPANVVNRNRRASARGEAPEKHSPWREVLNKKLIKMTLIKFCFIYFQLLGMGRYQYRYQQYRYTGTFFSIDSIGIGNQKIFPILIGIGSIGISAEVDIGISAKIWYRPSPTNYQIYWCSNQWCANPNPDSRLFELDSDSDLKKMQLLSPLICTRESHVDSWVHWYPGTPSSSILRAPHQLRHLCYIYVVP